MDPYIKESFPEHVLFVKDTEANRNKLIDILGEPKVDLGSEAYIKIDLKEKTWYGTPTFEWLYRNPPPLVTIEEIITKQEFQSE